MKESHRAGKRGAHGHALLAAPSSATALPGASMRKGTHHEAADEAGVGGMLWPEAERDHH